MKLSVFGLAGALMLPLCALAQTWQPPTPAQRCPSKWGAEDERGAANHMRPETVLRAARLIKTGEAIELGWVLGSDMPLVGTRRFDLHTKRTTGPMGSNKRYSNEELVTTELGQAATEVRVGAGGKSAFRVDTPYRPSAVRLDPDGVCHRFRSATPGQTIERVELHAEDGR